jgi:hypothetical protein
MFQDVMKFEPIEKHHENTVVTGSERLRTLWTSLGMPMPPAVARFFDDNDGPADGSEN